MTPEMEINGGNPCEGGGMGGMQECGDVILGGTNLSEVVSVGEPYLVYLYRSEDVSRFGFSLS